MALLTDGGLVTIEDLNGLDAGVVSLLASLGIDPQAKLSQGLGRVQLEVTTLLASRPRFGLPTEPVHPESDLGKVVVDASLHSWLAYEGLLACYEELAGAQANSLYQQKANWCRGQVKTARGRCEGLGLGLVNLPIPRAPQPVITFAAGNSAGQSYYISVSWTSADDEGAASLQSASLTSDGQDVVVQVGSAPNLVTGWNVYAGATADSLARQNFQPLGLKDSWTSAAGLVRNQLGPADGQLADYRLRQMGRLRRG